jgi:glyoxylase-like metal-dependent hydrolase (beta-lactamase superfamily II)
LGVGPGDPHGNFLIDTGETTHYYSKDHFRDPVENFVNRKILRLHIREKQHIDTQLKRVGLSVEKIDAVIMPHLHIDHTDGIRNPAPGTPNHPGCLLMHQNDRLAEPLGS